MAAAQTAPEAPPAPIPPPPEEAKRKRVLSYIVFAVVAVLILAAVGFVLLQGGGRPPAPQLASVQLTASRTILNQTETAVVTAVALDTDGKDQTGNVTWTWSATPINGVKLTKITEFRVTARGNESGPVTITAQATLGSSQKSGTASLTIEAVRFTALAATAVAELGQPTTITVIAVKLPAATFTSYSGTVHFTSTDPSAVLPADFTFSPANQGTRGFPITYGTYGSQTVTVRDVDVPTVTGSEQVTGDRRPLASFTNQSNAADGRIVTFTSTSTDPDGDSIASSSWEFGDGGTATGTAASVAHTYVITGIVTVNLTVTDSLGLSSAKKSIRYHSLGPPIASFRVENQRLEGAGVNVTVNATLSADVDGGGIAIYNWTWDDLKFSEVANPITYHVYGSAYKDKFVNVTLRVTDDDVTFYGAAVPHSNSTKFRFQVTTLPQPPVASFVWTVDSLNLIVRVDAGATFDPNGDIAFLNWTWGDGTYTNVTYNPLVTTFSHQYTYEKNFQINLTVIDKTIPVLTDVHRETVPVFYPPVPPIARFTVVKSGLSVDVDASTSTDLNKDIVSYEWDFGDGSTAIGVTATHTYPAATTYKITLKVTDSQPKSSIATRKVSVAATTLDYYFWDFLNVPYREYWDYRGQKYGDLPIGVDCFNASAVADGFCAAEAGGHHATDFSSYTDPSARGYTDIGPAVPNWYTNWYPAPSPNIRPGQAQSNPSVYAPYWFSVAGANVQGYNVSEPVFLPVFNYSVQPNPNSYVKFEWKYDLQTKADLDYFGATCGKSGSGFLDGFDEMSTVTLTMDIQTSRRLFDVTGDPLAWNITNADDNCRSKSAIETRWGDWFLAMAGTANTVGKYDVSNACEWYYLDVMDQVNFEFDVANDLTRVTLRSQSYTLGCLLARWFYWGNTSYIQNWQDSTKRAGWWGMELAWFEDMTFAGTLSTTAMDFNLTSIMQYSFQQEALPGLDGKYDKVNDIPIWSWRPILVDYLQDFPTSKHYASELKRYPYAEYVHTTPGTTVSKYGRLAPYDYVPINWDLKAGEEWHFQFPTGKAMFYDPRTLYGSDPTRPFTTDPLANGYIRILAPFTFSGTRPASVGDVDPVALTWDVYGPAAFGGATGTPGLDKIVGTADDQYALDGTVVPKISFKDASLVLSSVASVPPTAQTGYGVSAASDLPEFGLAAFAGTELQATFVISYFRRESS